MPQKKREKLEATYQHFIFEIRDWWPDYMFGLEHDKREPDLYREYAALIIKGTCAFPHDRTGTAALLRLVGERNIQKPDVLQFDRDWRPLGIGVLEKRSERLEYYAHLPCDAIWGLCEAWAQNGCTTFCFTDPQCDVTGAA